MLAPWEIQMALIFRNQIDKMKHSFNPNAKHYFVHINKVCKKNYRGSEERLRLTRVAGQEEIGELYSAGEDEKRECLGV